MKCPKPLVVEVYFCSIIQKYSYNSSPPFQVKVSVLDKNDSPPEFRDTPLRFTVSEDLGAGHAIATIRATDPDTIGTLTYTLVEQPGDGAPSCFQLDASSGRLTLRDTLDREQQDEYELVVRVSDGIQFTETTVTVQVSERAAAKRLRWLMIVIALGYPFNFAARRAWSMGRDRA